MKSRRIFLKQGTLAAAAVLVGKPLITFGSEPLSHFENTRGNSITILHTNDLHNHTGPVTDHLYSGFGGIEKTVEVVAGIREKTRNLILVDAGDIFSGDINQQEDHKATLQLMREAKYDAVLLGNRDYEAGIDYLEESWKIKNLPVVSSNYSFRNSWLKDLHQPYRIVQKGQVRVGIIGAGLNLATLVPGHLCEHISYNDPIEKLSGLATRLKQEKNCQLVICLSHLGYRNVSGIDDMALAARSSNIDIIAGGHSHTFMQTPSIVLNRDLQEVIINHAGFGGIALGNMTISFDDYGNKCRIDFDNLMIGSAANKWRLRA